MTTIVYRDGVMATDSRAYAGNKLPIGTKKKLHVLSNGALLGASCSNVGVTDAFAGLCQDLVDKGEFLPDYSRTDVIDVKALLVWIDGTVHYWNNSACFTGPLEGPFFAIGSGEEFALGALHAGVTAEQAVRIASACDVWTGGPIQTATLKKKRKK